MADTIDASEDWEFEMTVEFLQKHIAELQRDEITARAEFEEYIALHPPPLRGATYDRAWKLRARFNAFIGLIERHSSTLRSMQTVFVPAPPKAIKTLQPLPSKVKQGDSPLTPIHRGIDDVMEGEEEHEIASRS